MRRHAFFGTLLALVAAPFVGKATAADACTCSQRFRGDGYHQSSCGLIEIRTWKPPGLVPFKPPGLVPFAEFPAEIEAMETVWSANGDDDMLLVVSGGLGYLVDQHGTVTRL